MKNAKEFNVYDKISKGEYICKGDKLYTKDEMKKMFLKSGLSRGEVEAFWTLNADDAMREVKEMAGERFLTIRPEEEIYLSDEGWTVRKFYTLEKSDAFLVILTLIVTLFFAADLVASRIGGNPQNIKNATFSLVLLVGAYLTTFFIVRLCDLKWWKNAKFDAEVPEEALRTRTKKVVENRQKIMNSAINTQLMYECMEEYLMDE